MYKKYLVIFMAAILLLAACGKDIAKETNGKKAESKTITYLNQDYKVPVETKKIVTASQEAMEDAAVLGVKPIGAIATGGKFPEYLGDTFTEASEIGDKQQPSTEMLLKLKPDVILGTSKFRPEIAKNLNTVATMIPISHISTNWKENLYVLGELTGKKTEAEKIVQKYEADVTEVKGQIGEKLKDKKVAMIRIRGGSIFIYPADVYFNPVLYGDLGLPVPSEISNAKAQEMMTIEKLAEMNPDYLFVQFDNVENAENPDSLDDLQKNAIWKSINAVKTNQLFINAVSPQAAGGTALSKTQFIKVLKEKLAQ
jgi:iron complex transport system substrate-binding protein